MLASLTTVFREGVTCVSAPSGMGKTTLLRLLLGLERPDAGVIHGADCLWAAVFQENRLLEDRSAAANLRFALGDIPGEAGDLLARLGLELPDPRPIRDWSGGMKRRLALDEPFTGLDEENRARCLELIQERGRGKPVVLAVHGLAGLEGAPLLRLGEP